MCRVSRLPDETAVQMICSIIHTLLKLHLKHFINTEAREHAIVHVATSFLTIQTLDRPINTFLHHITACYLLACTPGADVGRYHAPSQPPPPPPISYTHISTCLGFYIVVFVFNDTIYIYINIYLIYIFIYIYIYHII